MKTALDNVVEEVSKLSRRARRELINEIAEYGERAYRRGVQQCVVMKVDEDTANKLRYSTDRYVFEIAEYSDGSENKFALVRRKKTYRLQMEDHGEIIEGLFFQLDL